MQQTTLLERTPATSATPVNHFRRIQLPTQIGGHGAFRPRDAALRSHCALAVRKFRNLGSELYSTDENSHPHGTHCLSISYQPLSPRVLFQTIEANLANEDRCKFQSSSLKRSRRQRSLLNIAYSIRSRAAGKVGR